ncbi:MAG: phosphatase PAP2 family protein [Anaerolineales bacterium]|nr:phosphatase PAP2 family protein [Anaerolineales bacterium]
MLAGLGLALAGILSGLAWRLAVVEALDARLMQRINQASWPGGVDAVLSGLRLAGTTGFFVVALTLVALANPGWALTLAVAALAAEGLTRAIKLMVRRPRPYATLPAVVVRLPRLPRDPRCPSGDAMRAVFLCGVVLSAAIPPWAQAVAVLTAAAVAAARVRAGAHYPLDVWAGAMLGLGAVIAWSGWATL